jgi:NFU1 iron-sulfur cluster scaffold homolog, mitochondrial
MKVVRIEETPNPDALKFLVDGRLVQSGAKSYDNAEAGKGDPLAEALFGLGNVNSVFYMDRFLTVTKPPQTAWDDLVPKVRETIESKAVPVPENGAPTTGAGQGPTPSNDEILARINQVLDENVRPALAGDGGGLEIMGYDNFVLNVHYQGACGSCPSSTAGTLFAIQNLLQRMVDPRIEVVSA